MEKTPRVRCKDCDFVWFGKDAAHGLSVLGHCSRCGGELSFEGMTERFARPAALEADSGDSKPSRVLGLPSTWR